LPTGYIRRNVLGLIATEISSFKLEDHKCLGGNFQPSHRNKLGHNNGYTYLTAQTTAGPWMPRHIGRQSRFDASCSRREIIQRAHNEIWYYYTREVGHLSGKIWYFR
jgi:hypothetical protein